MLDFAPIVVFVYNRPWHAEQTLEALSKNLYSDESTLYIFCDGPKTKASKEQIQKISDTRAVVRKKNWCKNVHIIEHEENKGLANSIIDGVSQVIKEYGRVIVLEDDLITSPFFLKFMNEALDFYCNYPSVFSVSADRPSVNKMQIPDNYDYDVFVSLRFFSYGWGTWINRWEKVDWHFKNINIFLNNRYMIDAFNRGGEDLTDMLIMQSQGYIDSWAIRFTFAHFYFHCVSVLPCVPYVDNIGFDGSGVHCGADETDYRNNVGNAPSNPRFIDVIYEDSRIINNFYNYYTKAKRPFWQKVCNRIARKFRLSPPFVIKKRIYVE